MRKGKPELKFLLDASVPRSVHLMLLDKGFNSIQHNQVLSEGTPDTVVCRAAIFNKAVLIAIDRDMKQLTKKVDKFKKLDLLMFCCKESQAKDRLLHALPLLNLEWEFRCAKAARRFWVEIGPRYIKTWR